MDVVAPPRTADEQAWAAFDAYIESLDTNERLFWGYRGAERPSVHRDEHPCNTCGSFNRVLDDIHCEVLCVDCGSVLDYDRLVDLAKPGDRHRESAGYQRICESKL